MTIIDVFKAAPKILANKQTGKKALYQTDGQICLTKNVFTVNKVSGGERKKKHGTETKCLSAKRGRDP